MVDTTWHDIETLNGVGPAIAERLAGVGIRHAEQLLGHPELQMVQFLEPIEGLTVQNLLGALIPQARLLRLEGLTEGEAIALANAGHNFASLMLSDTERLASTLATAGHDVDTEHLLRARLSAAQRYQKGTLLVQVLNQDRVAVPDAEVLIVDPPQAGNAVAWTHRTNEFGYALIEMIAAGNSQILAFDNDMAAHRSIPLVAVPRSLELVLTQEAPDGLTYDEEIDGPVVSAVPASRLSIDFVDIGDGTLLELVASGQDDAVLVEFYRKRFKLTWRWVTTRVQAGDLPEGVEPGALLRKSQDGLEDLGITAAAARSMLMQGNPLNL